MDTDFEQERSGAFSKPRTLALKLPQTPWEWATWMALRKSEGLVLGEIVRVSGKCRRTVQKALWLSTWPAELQKQCAAHPTIFTTRVLHNNFASKSAYWSENGFERLRIEVLRMIEKGPGSNPRKPYSKRGSSKGAKIELSPAERMIGSEQDLLTGELAKPDDRIPTLFEQMAAQELLRQALATQVKVDGKEIRVRYFGSEDLERIIDVIKSS